MIALLNAFDEVLSGTKSGWWGRLKANERNTLTIDEAISALDKLENEVGDLKVEVVNQTLLNLLTEHSKLEGRLSNQDTR